MNAVLIQHVYYYSPIFVDMARLTYPRHAAYAAAHRMDYWHMMGDGIHPEMPADRGGWAKIWLIKQAFEAGYEYVTWLDADAAIMNLDCDLRDALPEGKTIGACLHDPAKSEYLRTLQNITAHYNVGVTYFRNSPQTRDFVNAWVQTYPGDKQWLEQGEFNRMVALPEYAPLFARVDDTWNATVNVNMVQNPNVIGWHGVFPSVRRLEMMRQTCRDDCLRFRV